MGDVTAKNVTRSVQIERILGTLNLIFGGLGLIALLFNAVGYHGLPASFIQEYGPFMPKPFHEMVIASVILLPLLVLVGILLWRANRSAVVLCGMVFVAELIYFVAFWYRWPLGISPLNWPIVATGLLNFGLYLQIVTAYPVIGLILLGMTRRGLKKAPA